MKREPHWVKLFVRELERTGNVRLAAEGAGVDYTTAYQRRKAHAEFAQAWEGALRAFAGRLEDEGEGENAPPPAPLVPLPQKSGGGDLVVRPDGKLIRGSEARWGKRAEERFLLELTVSGSVRLAAKAAGFSTTAVYKRRLQDRRFAAAWEAAVETGKARVQAYLVEAATRTFDPDELPIADESEMPKVSVGEAINIAKLRSAAPAQAAEEPDGYDEDYLKEVRERILEKLQRLKERDERELGEAGWTQWDLPPRPNGSTGDTVWLPPEYRLAGPREA
jgi:hypothetical protein